MEIKNLLSRKETKLLTLLLTALLIASASAAVYYSLSMEPTVTITGALVSFEQGGDWPSGSSLGTNSTYVSLAIRAYPNATLTYDEPLNISNIDSSAHDIRLRHVSITPASGSASVSNFTFINFTLNSVDFDYTTTNDNWNTPSDMNYQSLPGNTEWALKIETRAAAGATD
ncbi:MAG: hypothetical protein JSV51_05665, partial [Candidatus Bathyarchaeota archaeon]